MLSETDKIDDYVSKRHHINTLHRGLIGTKISSLLDLRQAEFGRLQADDSARQANAIFIFTLMTIVFVS
jgi:hypothetical protein